MSRPRFTSLVPEFEGITVSRFTEVGSFDGVTVDGVTPPVLPDVSIIPVSAAQKVVTVGVPPFDPAAVVVPDKVHAGYFLTAPDPSLPSADKFALATATGSVPFAGSGDLSISVDAPAGTYAKVIVFAEFPA
jgi:hypothetical protein